jgi:hypothetical protein
MVAQQQITAFLKVSSFRGLLALYACQQSKTTGRPFIMTDLFAQSEGYVNGFLVACSSFGLLELVTHRTVTTVEQLDENLSNQIRAVIYQRADDYDKEKSYALDHEFSWMRKIKVIEAYFTGLDSAIGS